ncbi:MAG: hypothetical protein U0575_14515 [Phycisphaerales bacterium]
MPLTSLATTIFAAILSSNLLTAHAVAAMDDAASPAVAPGAVAAKGAASPADGPAAKAAAAKSAPPAATEAQPGEAPVLFDLEFAGGTLREYLAALRRATPAVNLVVGQEAEALPIPRLSLKRIDLVTALSLIEREEKPGTPDALVVEIVRVNAEQPDAQPTFRVQVTGAMQVSSNAMAVESIGDVIESGIPAGTILDAVESGLRVALGERASLMDVKYHEPTRLILARGPVEGQQTLKEIIRALRGSSGAAKSRSDLSAKQSVEQAMQQARQQFESQLLEARSRIGQLEGAVEAAKSALQTERDRAAVQERRLVDAESEWRKEIAARDARIRELEAATKGK